jgi:Helicase associated domain
VLTGGERDRFDDASVNTNMNFPSPGQDSVHLEDATMMEANDSSPNEKIKIGPSLFPGTCISTRAVETHHHPPATFVGDTNTPLHKFNALRLNNGQPCRLGVLLLAAETAVSPIPHRSSYDSSKYTTSSKRSVSSTIMNPSLLASSKAWHWYKCSHETIIPNSNTSNGGTPLTLAESESDGHDRNHLTPASHGYSANSSRSTEGSTNEDGEESDDCSEETEEHDQTVVVIRDGLAQYTVHRQPTPEKQQSLKADNPTQLYGAAHYKQVTFAERLVQIQKYKQINGHVSRFTTRDKSLSRFISNKRSDHRQGKLRPEKAAHLRALGVPGFDEDDILVPVTGPVSTMQQHNLTSPRTKTSILARAPGVAEIPQRERMTMFSSRNTTPLESENLLRTMQRVSRPPGRLGGDVFETYLTNIRSSPSPAIFTADHLATHEAKIAKKSYSKKLYGKRGQSHLFVSWADRIVQLEEYCDIHGHSSVPATKHKTKDGELGRWLAAQRSLHKKRQLKPDRAKDLRRMKCDGFV